MAPEYSITVSPAFDLVRMRLAGFFQPADIERFRTDRDLAHGRLRCGPNQHITLVDIRDMAIQSQAAVAGFTAVMHTPEIYSRKLAIVVGASLARSQIKRAAEGRAVAYFETIEAAERWLFAAATEAA